MEFLWIRWFEIIGDDWVVQQEWKSRQLGTIQFCWITDKEAFGFVDPNNILWLCHIIPRFFLGRQRSGEGTKPQ